MIKRLITTLTATLAILAGSSQAQISVPAGGAGPITFSLTAGAAGSDWTSPGQWSTLSLAGAGNTYLTFAPFNTAVTNTAASAINQALGSSTTVPPSANAVARWNGALFVLQSRPTGNAATLLMATLRNDAPGNVSALTVTYDFATQSPQVVELPGLYVYWSLNGSPGSWAKLDALSGTEASGNYSATIPLGSWGPGEPLYIMWADDNGDGFTDPSYTIDNVSFVPTTGNNVSVTSPANGASFAQGSPITLSATAIMPNPVTSVSWFDNGTLIGSDTTSPYTISWSTAALGSHTITARSTDGTSTINSTNVVIITVHPNQPPVIAAVTNDQAVTQIKVGSLLTYTAVATDDGTVTNVQFRVDGTTRWNDRTSPFTFAWCDMTAGTHTLTAIASDDLGVKVTNTASITVTNVPDTTVLLANGSLWKYWDQGVDPGSNWKDLGFNDSGWSNGIAEIGYGDTDANRPESTVSRQIVGTPGDPSAITNATQLFRTHFTVGSLSSFTGLVVRLMADDGAVVYINGNPVANLNMTAGMPYTAFTTAGSTDDGAGFFDYNIPANSVVPGDNLAAVEVRQSSATSSDISFDLMILGVRPPAPTLRLTYSAPNFDLSWPGGLSSYCVQSKATLDDPWQDVGGVCHPADASDLPDPVDGRYHMGFDIDSFQSPTQFFRLAPNTGN